MEVDAPPPLEPRVPVRPSPDQRAITLPNRLLGLESARYVYFSAWASDVRNLDRYRNFRMCEGAPLFVGDDPEPLPVQVDPATATYLRSRHVKYFPQVFRNAAGETRVRITKVEVRPAEALAPDAPPPIDMPFAEFLPSFLADYEVAEDSDEDADQPPVKRR